ncbi:MAG: DUF3570 domain-containing protein [Myxococcales bacterium FL481]|nr:MAG: DUF3570 domain-containing protein [Myxococcales bacterium FL481]
MMSRLALLLALVAALVATSSRAEDRIIVRGNYYREASTRVLQPLVTFSKDLPDERLTVGVDYLLDAISSASIAAGAAVLGGDKVFTELRHETAARVSSQLGGWGLHSYFRYSTETDYVARATGLSVSRQLLQRTLTVFGRYSYGFNRAYRITNNIGALHPWRSNRVTADGTRPGPTNLLASHYGAVGATQLLSPYWMASVSVETADLQGPQDNPYRSVGNNLPEIHPWRRRRLAPVGEVRWSIPRTPLALEQRYRYYIDDWGISAHATDSRLHLRLFHVLRLRARYRFYTQSSARFARADGFYLPNDPYRTADPKLSAFVSHTPGIELTYEFDGLARMRPFRWLAGGWVQATYNHVFQTNRFGPARLGSLAFSLAF